MPRLSKMSNIIISGWFVVACLLPMNGYGQINNASKFPDRIILNLTADPTNSAAISWRTDTTIHESYCQWQLATDTKIKPEAGSSEKVMAKTVSYSFKDESTIAASQFSYLINGLKPGTRYVYRVGTGNFWSEWFEFKTHGINNEPYSFLYFGDPQIGLNSEWPRVLRKAYQHCPDCRFMLYAGDLINRAGHDSEWDEWFKTGSWLCSTVPQIMTPGNHDYAGKKLDSHWNNQFTQPQNGPSGLRGTCFFIDYPNLRLISIDSAADSELGDEKGYPVMAQKVWLDSLLATNTAKLVILTTHLPFYSTKDTRDNPRLRSNIQPILEKYHVDLVLTGHDHAYGRGRASDNPMIKPSIVYVVSVSGPKLYPSGTKSWMERSGGNVQLFQVISVQDDVLEYKSLTANGNLFDAFKIERKKSGKKRFVEMKPASAIQK